MRGLGKDLMGMTLESEFSQYPLDDEAEWMDGDVLEAVTLDSTAIAIEPEPFDAQFETVKQSMKLSPMDPTKTFKMEKVKTGIEVEDVTKDFCNEKKSYIEETDENLEFESSKQTNIVESVDNTQYWRLERSDVIQVTPVDPETSFVSEKQEFGVIPDDPAKDFQNDSKKQFLERADISDTFKTETRMVCVFNFLIHFISNITL